MAMLKVLVEEVCSSISSGLTPQHSCSRRATDTSLVIARIGVLGRNLLTLRAVAPPLVRVRIAEASSWRAIELTAWLMALGIVEASWLSSPRRG